MKEVIMGCAMLTGIIIGAAAVSGACIWVAFWLLHMVFPAVPEITYIQAIIVGIALSIIGSYFKSSNTKSGS